MAVYNPYDQVIFEDPAYLTDADKAKEQIQEETRGIADIIARTAGPIAGVVTNPEKYQQTLDQEQRNRQILEQLGITNRQLTRDELERAKAAGYVPLTTGQALGKISGFLYSDLVKGSENIRAGVDYYDLPENERMGVAMGLLDMADIALIPAVFKKLATIGVQKLGKTNLKTMAQDPELQKQFPAETQEILAITGGGYTPKGVVFDAEKGSGLASSTPNIYTKIKNYLDSVDEPKTVSEITKATGLTGRQVRDFKYQESQINLPYKSKIKTDKQMGKLDFLLDYFKKNPNQVFSNRKVFEDEGIGRETIYQFITKYPQYRKNFNNTFESNISNRLKKGIEKLKSIKEEKLPTQELEKILGYKTKAKINELLDKGNLVEKGVLTQDELDYINSFRTNLSRPELEKNKRMKKLKEDLIANPEFQNLGTSEISRKFKIPRGSLIYDMNKDPELYALVVPEQKLIGSTDSKLTIGTIRKVLDSKVDSIDAAIIDNLYRGVKEIEGYTPEQFLTLFKKQNPNFKKSASYKKARKAYDELENERIKLQKEATNYFNKKLKDPRYSKYLKESDRQQFIFDKSHAFFISDATKQDRFLNMGQMSDLIFNAPVGSNIRLQQRFDKPARIIANLTDKENLKALENTPVDASIAELDRRFRLNIPEIIQRLEEYGIQIYPEDFKNLKELIFGKGGIREGIEKAYKDQGVGTLVPVGEEKIALVGKNPKKVSARQRFNLLKKRFEKILDDQILYEKTNGKKGKPIMRQGGDETEGGFILGLQDGGEVKPVRMAIGGDPLANMNQQQYSPDPAFDDDYFQQAVESGNLQAANLFNLFKVFKKPKVMATPSNVKQVQQANEALPQAVPGTQEIAPMQAGKPDFFFKSYLLDQLNSPNAPKASNPQGWREFLIKGKKVPEAEMADTGILQYLEDTEKFYPDKKITREEIENLYDMSPLGNLEVRVKPVRGYPEGENVPQESFEFFADQGTQKHRGVGNAEIDNAAEEYFEVVVNVPNLPGQERAYVNSAHFSEPNVLGFTRVGTYKNNAGDKVAVIQEMQTDMLTEVRKEQERLFAMVNNLKRQRAQKVENINRADPSYRGYEENELRMFDQKYPPELLDALETENLIQPFPNIVAKDLIPERTRSLNQIQEDINKLMMGNVEQYADPAYKTKVFDLAQEQNRILEELMSMNRSSNYKEKLQGFKVPSTSDRAELESIAYTQTYTPSGYYMKDLESFPPIPFNKQADYVDLLIKSTIKAAKQKGIDKVAIMPADVGANPRWRKTSDEAKKKFQNLYDKVGVQQLKNIAKKYGGKLEIEKIVDPNKNTRGLTFLNKNPEGEFQILKQTEARSTISDAERDAFYDEEIKRIASGNTEPGDVVLTREIAPGQMMDYYIVEGRGDATDVGYRMIPLKEGESADDAMIKIVEYNPSEVDMYTISFDPSKLEEPMYLFKKKSGGSIDKDSLVSITDIYGEYGR